MWFSRSPPLSPSEKSTVAGQMTKTARSESPAVGYGSENVPSSIPDRMRLLYRHFAKASAAGGTPNSVLHKATPAPLIRALCDNAQGGHSQRSRDSVGIPDVYLGSPPPATSSAKGGGSEPRFATLTCASRHGHPIAHPVALSHCLREDAFLICYASRFARIVADVTAVPSVMLTVLPPASRGSSGSSGGAEPSCFSIYGRAYVVADGASFVRFPAPMPPSYTSVSTCSEDRPQDAAAALWEYLRLAVFGEVPGGLRLGPGKKQAPAVRVVAVPVPVATPTRKTGVGRGAYGGDADIYNDGYAAATTFSLNTKMLPTPPQKTKSAREGLLLPQRIPSPMSARAPAAAPVRGRKTPADEAVEVVGAIGMEKAGDGTRAAAAANQESAAGVATGCDDFVLLVVRIERVEETSCFVSAAWDERVYTATREGSWLD